MRLTIRELVYGALACALVAALGQLGSVNIGPVPITFQTLGVMLVGLILPRRTALMGLLVFILLVGFGAPLLSGGRGGYQVLIGTSAGYIWSWPVAAYAMAWMVERLGRRYWTCMVASTLFGIGLVYLVGAPVLKLLVRPAMSWSQALYLGALVFVPGDLLKAAVASYLAVAVARGVPGLAPGARPAAGR